VLYGVGARLDEKPALLFALRGVDENQLLANAGQELSVKKAVPATTKKPRQQHPARSTNERGANSQEPRDPRVQAVSLELLDAFAWLTDRSGSRPTVRIHFPPPFRPSHNGIVRESRKIGACARDLRSRTDPENVSAGANPKNRAKPIRVRFGQVHPQGKRHRDDLPHKGSLRNCRRSSLKLLMHSGVRARCRQVMGTIHGTEIFPTCCPDISHATATDIANFCAR
jgi:hypothetical protein